MRRVELSFREAVPMLLSAGGSVALFYSGLFSFLFAVPVQVMYTKEGPVKGAVTAGVSAAVIVVVHLLQVLRLEEMQPDVLRLLFLDSLMPVGVLAGLTVINVDHRRAWWIRLLMGSAVALLGAVPSLRIIAQMSEGAGPLSAQVDSMMTMLGVSDDAGMVLETVRTIAMNTIGIGLVAALSANWWLGRSIVLRRYGLVQSLRPARVADALIWVVIAGLAVVIMTWISGESRLAPFGWNALLIGAYLFAIQGVGLIQHLIRRRGAGDRGERWVPTVVLMLLFVPGLNIIAVLGVPLLGMSEIWVDYKRGENYEGDTER
jgi:hypothetical protein